MSGLLNYKKPGFWCIVVGVIVIIGLATGLITNPIVNESEKKTEEFLMTYYTIENTDIADMFFDESLNPIFSPEPMSEIDENGDGIVEVKGVEEAVNSKYGGLMTEEALNRASANRVLLAGEMAAREYGSRLEPKKVNINEEKISDHGTITYNFDVEALVKFKDGTKKVVDLTGTIDMVKVEGTWKVSNFKQSNLNLALKLRQSNLYITNKSNAPIRRIEVDTIANSTGAMNADNSDMDKNYRFGFEMLDILNLDYSVKLLDEDDKILLNQSFVGDFSDGKIIKLYIEDDVNGNLSIQDDSSISLVVNEDGSTSISNISEPKVSITSEISTLTALEYLTVGTASIENPTKDDFRKFTFKLYVENSDEIESRKISLPDYHELFNDDRSGGKYWYGSNMKQDNEGATTAEYTYDIMLFTRDISNDDIINVLNSEDVIVSWTYKGETNKILYRIGDITEFK